ncbi:apolipoprotein L3-like [Peromyscus eremicus]|uniref:apolipoprotein L3-like n=1 Tax=Peromyscus eremicus TaxID=42410 RepID=UPI0027DD7677|nr:apolipoprotein L3-like [Peromyscus eremicus]
MGSPERKGFIESVVEYLWDTRSKVYLQLQLTEVVEWQQPVEGAALSSFNIINLMLAAGLLYIAYIIFRKWETSLREAPGEIVADPDGEDVNEEELQSDLQDKTRREKEAFLCEAPLEMVADPDGEKDEDEQELQNDLQDKTVRKEETSLHDALGERVGDPDGEEDVHEDKLQNDLQDKTRRKCSVVSTGQILPTSCLPLSVGLSCHREEEDALHEARNKTIVDADGEDDKKLQQNLQDKKRFLEDYPQVKLELEQQIRKLHALADKIDKVHRDCTITQVVAKSTGAVSGVLTILGLALAPVTAGLSLGLSATGLGLGAAAAVTSVSTSLVEKVITVSAEAKASQLGPTSKDKEEVIKEVLEENTPGLISVYKNSIQNLEDIKKNIDAIKLAKADSHLKTNAKRLITTGKVSAQNTRKVEKAFGGTALAMTKEARIMGATNAGLSILMDVVSLVEDSKHLHEGAKAESAAELRQQAQDLEQKLKELIRVHDSLTK